MTPLLPDPAQWARLAPSPGTPVWRAFNDVRMLSTAVYATLLQVADPTVGEGVHQYSSFTRDPWGRLLRTLDYVHGTIYGGPALAGSVGRRVRERHRTIRGVGADGTRFNAMEPAAFAWVHATLAAAIFVGRASFASPMTPDERQAFWTQWLSVGRLIGVRERDLPADIAGFDAYFSDVSEQRLVRTAAVPQVLASVSRAAPPPIPGLRHGPWRLLALPGGRILEAVTRGLMTPRLRSRLGLSLTRADRTTFASYCALSRHSGALIRRTLPEFGVSYVRWRREALARGDVAGGRVELRHDRAADVVTDSPGG
ncbi:MAG: oxygenase MpaB family protein [Solirubrobacteraceae bacterium]